MADINISKFTTQVLRVGSTPSSPGFAVDEGQDPVDPSGNPQTHLPVTIAAAADALSITDAQVLSGAGTTAQYIRGNGSLATFPSLTGYVPYTGATADVDLGTHDLTAERGTFANNGSSDTLTVNHTSGSGYGIIVTKGGNNEALYVSKTSGSGNAMTVIGGDFQAGPAKFGGTVRPTTNLGADLGSGSIRWSTLFGRNIDLTEGAIIAGTLSTTSDAVINGVNIGKGEGSLATNTIIGTGALSFNTTGSSNTSAGFQSLQFNTTGSSNTSVGINSLNKNTSGSSNTSVGNNSLIENTTGFANTAIGSNAGRYISDGTTSNSTANTSIFIGVDSKALANNQSNQIVIGNNSIGNGTHTVTIGNSFITDNYFTGNIRGGAFIKSGGTSSQFLKADGSVDSTSYGAGTVTSVAALTLGTSGTDLSSTVANGTTTPVITLNVPTASATNRGALSSADWTTFNNKASTADLANYLPLTGGTLTGGLNGTSTVFSSSVTALNTILTGVGGVLSRTGASTTAVYGLFLNTSGGLYFGSEGSAGGTIITGNPAYYGAISAVSGLGFSANNGTNVHLSLDSSGAATFLNLAGSGTRMVVANSGGLLSTQTINLGTVTSVGLSSATSGVTIGSTPITTSGTITLAIATASGSQNGLLSSSDWTTFNGKQNSLTNPVTGTGTTNYLPKFTGASTIGNSQVIDNGTEVGIGLTPTSGFKLDVGYDGTNRSVLRLSSNAANRLAAITFYGNNAESGTIGYEGGSEIVGGGVQGDLIIRNNLNKNIVLSGANVLIGTTTDAGYKLNINSATTGLHVGNASNSVKALATFSKTLTSGFGTANNYLQLGAGENGVGGTRLIGFGYSITSNTNQPAYIGYVETSNSGETNGSLIFGTRSVTTDTAPTTRLTIASTGEATFSNIVNVGFDSGNRSILKLTSNAANRLAAVTFYGNNAESSIIGYEGGSEILSGGVQGDLVIRNVLANKNIILATNNGNVGINTVTPNSRLQVAGSFATPHVTKSANYTLDASDYTVGFDCASSRTANLPDATTCAGRIYVIYQYNTNNGARYVTLDGSGSQTIDGVTTYSLQYQIDFSSLMIQSTGSNWVVISDKVYPAPV